MKIAIVDNDEVFRNQIKNIILNYNNLFEIYCFESGKLFLESNVNDYQIVFLDINAQDLDSKTKSFNGIEIGKRLDEMACETMKFYVSSCAESISQALRTKTFQFFLKPINENELLEDLNRAIIQFKKRHTELKVKWNTNISSVAINSINYIESYKRVVTIHLIDRTIIKSSGTLKKVFNDLHLYNFVSSHKSFIVNLKYVKKIDNSLIIMENGETPRVSKNFKSNLKEKLNAYIKEKSL
ncbi:MAG: LytTR family DNA-binding domain-containing protein [Clostridia bacterium]